MRMSKNRMRRTSARPSQVTFTPPAPTCGDRLSKRPYPPGGHGKPKAHPPHIGVRPHRHDGIRKNPVPSCTMSISSHDGPMPALRDVLERLKLTSYHDALLANGFHSWDTVLDITEEDLTSLGVKLGHRRSLQREIATWRGVPSTLALEAETGLPSPGTGTGTGTGTGAGTAGTAGTAFSSHNTDTQPSLSTSALETLEKQTTPQPPREKRRYRRHPRPDSNAPRKPKTAYVNFADELRTTPEISALSFVDIAKEVGRRWQELLPEKKRVWEGDAARAMQEYETQMDAYKSTDNWRKYQTYLSEFKSLQQRQALLGKRPASTRSTGSYSQLDLGQASPPASSENQVAAYSTTPSASGYEAQMCQTALTLALGELGSLRGEILGQGALPYDQQNLPPEQLVRRAMYAFVQGTGSLLYMWTYDQVDQILERIYRPYYQTDAISLAECFIVAAMGAHYDMDCVPERTRRLLYASGTLCFNEVSATHDYLRTMRLLLSMSFYALLEKHMSARYLISAGLQIARWKCPSLTKIEGDVVGESWRKVFRSLIFMDCWLSYTLGYTAEVTPLDIAIACAPTTRLVQASIDEQIHVQTSKVGLIAAEIAKTVASPELATSENIAMLTGKLEAWRMQLPLMLQISILTSDNPPPLNLHQRRAILMVHIMYLGALILLYRHLLVAIAEKHLPWTLKLSVEDAQKYGIECAVAGQQIARILSLISFDGTLSKRCWLIIYWAFTASIVLLFSATAKLLDGQPDGVEQDLTWSKACMDMLEPCRNFEPIAAQYLQTLWPLYDHLRAIHHRIIGRAKTSIFSLLQSDPNTLSPPIPVSRVEIGPISEKLLILLRDPFGRKQGFDGEQNMRRLLNVDGTRLLFWWK
ncbi:unnamed protein product [Periconia digitata]|uniref:HMG box domain-containing protein n=1 Tax=Periconia digitata TaxID=1303443 RepID=A0A9W4XT29_9PLEO|nr:unnamed protein product [Periconia digitata]